MDRSRGFNRRQVFLRWLLTTLSLLLSDVNMITTEDKYLPSYLVFSRYHDIVFHILFAADVRDNNVRIVTAYYPDHTHWNADLKTRRKS